MSSLSRNTRTLLLRAQSLKLLIRPYSSSSTPLITATDIPAPNTGRIRIISLNRPSARNAISRQLLTELRTHIDDVSAMYTSEGAEAPAKDIFGGAAGVDQRGPVRALILASSVDSSFCAGADLKERTGFTKDE
jgi:methylglutaconyl-CoA hydratase